MAFFSLKFGRLLKGTEGNFFSRLNTLTPNLRLRSYDCCKKFSDPPIKNKESALLKPEEMERLQKQENEITTNEPIDITSFNGRPKEYSGDRTVRIYKPSKNLMQSGTDNIHHWELEFDNRERWENPCIGWISSGDSHSNLKISFATKNEAIAFCDKNKWRWFVDETPLKKPMKPKDYSEIYAWNRRTRASTK